MLCGFKSFGFAFVFLTYPQTQLVNSCEHYEVAYFLIAFLSKKTTSIQTNKSHLYLLIYINIQRQTMIFHPDSL